MSRDKAVAKLRNVITRHHVITSSSHEGNKEKKEPSDNFKSKKPKQNSNLWHKERYWWSTSTAIPLAVDWTDEFAYKQKL